MRRRQPVGRWGHFQKEVGGATDPAYANPTNEIWLDFTTDEFGNAVAQTVVPWQFDTDRRAQSVVVHQRHTHTGDHGPAGTAGARLACLTAAF